jgi:hypothetical protein
LVKNDIISGVKQKYRINLNRAEEEALQDLLSDQCGVQFDFFLLYKIVLFLIISQNIFLILIKKEFPKAHSTFPFFNISNQFGSITKTQV